MHAIIIVSFQMIKYIVAVSTSNHPPRLCRCMTAIWLGRKHPLAANSLQSQTHPRGARRSNKALRITWQHLKNSTTLRRRANSNTYRQRQHRRPMGDMYARGGSGCRISLAVMMQPICLRRTWHSSMIQHSKMCSMTYLITSQPGCLPGIYLGADSAKT